MEEKKMPFPEKEKYVGIFGPTGKEIKFNRNWSTYRFSDEECEALLTGKEIMIRPTSKKTGKPYDCYGRLALQSFVNSEGKEVKYYGFSPDFDSKRVPSQFCNYTFSEKEIQDLNNGITIYCMGLVGKSGKEFNAFLRFNKQKGIEMSFTNDEE